MHSHLLKSWSRVFALAVRASVPVAMAGQDAPKPAPRASQFDSPSRWDFFAGYSYLAPKGTVDVLPPAGVPTLPQTFKSMNSGSLGSGTYYFNRHVAAQLELGAHALWAKSSSRNGGA